MSKITSLVAALSLVATSATLVMPTQASAVPIVAQTTVTGGSILPVEDSAYFYGGRRYCFYSLGWRGPGFYLCGFPYRRGFFFAPGYFGGGFGGYGYRRGFGFHRGFGGRGFGHGGFHGGFGHRGFGGGHFGGHRGGFGGGHRGGGHFGGGHRGGGGHMGGGHHGGGGGHHGGHR